ncbi:MAG: hypothetical protein LQ346_008488 [Caloplaca aetnensis]|nr:MAG: hypothetical protein LQ346_008488 [Caloplaca aetnensis]
MAGYNLNSFTLSAAHDAEGEDSGRTARMSGFLNIEGTDVKVDTSVSSDDSYDDMRLFPRQPNEAEFVWVRRPFEMMEESDDDDDEDSDASSDTHSLPSTTGEDEPQYIVSNSHLVHWDNEDYDTESSSSSFSSSSSSDDDSDESSTDSDMEEHEVETEDDAQEEITLSIGAMFLRWLRMASRSLSG